MSPQAPAGTRGYTDFQRVDNWDSPLLYTSNAVIPPGGEVTPTLDVSRYGYLAGFDGVGTAIALAGFIWCMDSAFTIQVAQRVLMLSSNINFSAQYRLQNLGPFLQVKWLRIAGVPSAHAATLFATNRTHPLEFIPQNPVLIDQQNVGLGAGLTNTLYPSDYYSGPVDFALNVNGANWGVVFRYLNSAGVWDYLDEVTLSNGVTNYRRLMPSSAWRAEITNSSGGANTYYMTATPSTTGAT